MNDKESWEGGLCFWHVAWLINLCKSELIMARLKKILSHQIKSDFHLMNEKSFQTGIRGGNSWKLTK